MNMQKYQLLEPYLQTEAASIPKEMKCHSCKSMKHTQPLLTVMSILLNLRQTPEKKRPHQQLTLVTVAGNGVYLKIENLLIFVFWNMYRSYRSYCLLYQADK